MCGIRKRRSGFEKKYFISFEANANPKNPQTDKLHTQIKGNNRLLYLSLRRPIINIQTSAIALGGELINCACKSLYPIATKIRGKAKLNEFILKISKKDITQKM